MGLDIEALRAEGVDSLSMLIEWSAIFSHMASLMHQMEGDNK